MSEQWLWWFCCVLSAAVQSVSLMQSASNTGSFDQSTPTAASFDQSTPTAASLSYSMSTSFDHQIRVTTTLNRTPERTGEITTVVSATVPDRVTELTVRIPAEATVAETDEFSESDTSGYEWDTRTDGPTVTFRVPADQRVSTIH